MPQFGQGGGSRRPPIIKGAVIMRLYRGQLIAQAWPRARGKPKTVYQRDILARMKQVQFAVKRLNDREVNPTRQALDAWNRRNRGYMGTATIRLRDLLTAQASGRLLAWLLPNGQWIIHIDALQDYSRRLDWLEPAVGSLLVRTTSGWRPTFACAAGARLYAFSDNPSSGCCPPAAYQPNEV